MSLERKLARGSGLFDGCIGERAARSQRQECVRPIQIRPWERQQRCGALRASFADANAVRNRVALRRNLDGYVRPRSPEPPNDALRDFPASHGNRDGTPSRAPGASARWSSPATHVLRGFNFDVAPAAAGANGLRQNLDLLFPRCRRNKPPPCFVGRWRSTERRRASMSQPR